VAVRVRRSRGERTWVWIMAACSSAHAGQSWSKASWSSLALRAARKVFRSIIILSWRRVLMVPLVILPMVVVVGVGLISGAQFLGPGRCVNVDGCLCLSRARRTIARYFIEVTLSQESVYG